MNHKVFKYYWFVLLVIIIGLGCNNSTENLDIVLLNVNVVDVVNGNIIPSQDVLISEGVISDILDHVEQNYQAERMINGDGQYLIPGLWDMHVHAVRDADYEYALPMYIANGITGIRDMSGDLKLRDSLEVLGAVGGLSVPRMLVSGSILGGNPARNGTSVATLEEGVEYVEILAENGADFIKTYEYLRPEIYEAILKRTKELNIPVYGHPPKLVGISKAMQLGQKSFEHLSQIPFWCTPYSEFLIEDMSNHWYGPGIPLSSAAFEDTLMTCFDESVLKSLAMEMVENQAYFCPTIMVYEKLSYPWKAEEANAEYVDYLNPFGQWTWEDDISWAKGKFQADSIGFIPKLNQRKHILSKMISYGVPIVAGTDAGVSMHGFDLHKELVHYVAAGMTLLEALQSATLRPAELLNIDNEAGRVSKGYRADLVLLSKNPLEDIRNTQTIEATIVNGQFHNKNELNTALSVLNRKNDKIVLDTLRKVLERDGIEEVLALTKQWEQDKADVYLGGSQLTLLSYEMMRADRMEEASSLLKEEIRLNAFNANFASWSLVELMGETYGIDSAMVYGSRDLERFGPGHVHIASILKRIDDPSFGRPSYQQIDSLKVAAIQGDYMSTSEEKIKLLWRNNSFSLMLNDQWQTLSAINDSVFYVEGYEPDRILIKEASDDARSVYYITGRSTIIYNMLE